MASAHLLQLELHATPDAAEIDRHHPVVIVTGRIGSLYKDILNTGIVVGCIELSESGDSLLNHCFYPASSATSQRIANVL